MNSTLDHLMALTVFLAATLLFIGLFNSTIQTAVTYQRNKTTAHMASDLLDNVLLNPGTPINWGHTDIMPTRFGLQDPEFTQYKISPFSLMRLFSTTQTPVFYPKTGTEYSNITIGSNNFLLLSNNSAIDYATVSQLLGVSRTYGFQLSFNPIVTVSITEDQSEDPLRVSIDVQGTGFPLANAKVNYCFITVLPNGGESGHPAFITDYGTTTTDQKGLANLEFNAITDDQTSYALVVHANLNGLTGVGFHERVSSPEQYIIPFIDNLNEGRVLLAHSYDVHYFGPPVAEVKYNATFVLLAEDYSFRQIPLENSADHVTYGDGWPYNVINIPTTNPGILIITYQSIGQEVGVIMMPWGLSSLAFPVTFGGNPQNQEWVATDLRQILVGGIAYQVKIAVWSLEGYQVIG
jgi:hypothetical protein